MKGGKTRKERKSRERSERRYEGLKTKTEPGAIITESVTGVMTTETEQE